MSNPAISPSTSSRVSAMSRISRPTSPVRARPTDGGVRRNLLRTPIGAGMSRSDCVDWWAARYDRPPERSACVACPFQPRQRWVETKRRWPKLFAEAVDIDARMRGGLALDKTPYLHSLQMPLPEAVALDGADMGPDGQTDAFGNECEGHCGV